MHQTYNQGVEDSAQVLLAKAAELHALNNPTATMMARIFEEQAEAVRALKKS